MPLQRLELFNFKSYKGSQVFQTQSDLRSHQVIDFGDAPFMCIIGPNGAGKSNLMDAISFVLGIKSAQLRSTQLKDLIYRGRKAAESDEDAEETQDDHARNAHVIAVYEDGNGKEWRFKRRLEADPSALADISISLSGQSSYHLNGKETTYKAYNHQLEKFNVLVKAKNFLVFQGDVESVASQDSHSLAQLIDRISGLAMSIWVVADDRSADHAAEYEKAKEDLDKATEASTSNYAKKRSMLTEAKLFREQKAEVKQWERLERQKASSRERLRSTLILRML